jgi:diaminohydroxyphosphoribosylaminopyrimidine deaminase/5-amino-6-(5-phosphoribosylamino)uracil reductase
LIVEGGKQLLDSFIAVNLWDKAFRFVGNKHFKSGIEAPKILENPVFSETIDDDRLFIYKNTI